MGEYICYDNNDENKTLQDTINESDDNKSYTDTNVQSDNNDETLSMQQTPEKTYTFGKELHIIYFIIKNFSK